MGVMTMEARKGMWPSIAVKRLGRTRTAARSFSEGTNRSIGYHCVHPTGNQITFTNNLGRVTTNVYDALNREVEVLYADSTKTLTGYDAGVRRGRKGVGP